MPKYYSRTPTDDVVKQAACFPRDRLGEPLGIYEAAYDRWKAQVEAAAEQRGAIKALRDAAESHDVIDHMYKYFDNHPIQAPAAVRATANYLHNRADRLEGDNE